MKPSVTSGFLAAGVAAALVVIGAVSTAKAGSHVGGVYLAGSAFRNGSIGQFHTNQGGKYTFRNSGEQFHTNQGGKYTFRNSGAKFHTNPGGKYVWSY